MNSRLSISWLRSMFVLSSSLVLCTSASAQTKVILTDLTDCSRHPCPASTRAVDINDSGQVIGHITTARSGQGFVWTAEGGMVVLEESLGPVAINNAGQVAGTMTLPDGSIHAFLWSSEGGVVDLGTLGGGQRSFGRALNNAGQVVGYSFIAGDCLTRAFVWSPSTGMVDLGTPEQVPSNPTCPSNAPSTLAWAINDAGQVVGQHETPEGSRAFSWTAEGGIADSTHRDHWVHAIVITRSRAS
jgi:probable HAF family extracellular repeat protein